MNMPLAHPMLHQWPITPADALPLALWTAAEIVAATGGIEAALVAYNGGPERAKEWIKSNFDDKVLPAETRKYYKAVMARLPGYRENNGKGDPNEPMPTLTAQGNHIAEVRAFLTAYFGNERDGQPLTDPMRTVTSKQRFGLVTVEGIEYQIVDIGLRMLRPRELYRAQGFPDDYVIAPIVRGKAMPVSAQVKLCGNSVPPQLSEALVRANFATEAAPKRRRKAVLA